MSGRGCRDEGIVLCTHIRNVQLRAATRDCGIDSKDSAGKGRQ
jgi:hypothetical protein